MMDAYKSRLEIEQLLPIPGLRDQMRYAIYIGNHCVATGEQDEIEYKFAGMRRDAEVIRRVCSGCQAKPKWNMPPHKDGE